MNKEPPPPMVIVPPLFDFPPLAARTRFNFKFSLLAINFRSTLKYSCVEAMQDVGVVLQYFVWEASFEVSF